MPDTLQPGFHLSPDELSAFAENALPEHERLAALTHLAACADCRQVVFFAQQADPAFTAPSPVAPQRRAWFSLPQLFIAAGAALACSLILATIVHLRDQEAPAAQPVSIAKLEPPQSSTPAPTSPAPIAADHQLSSAGTRSFEPPKLPAPKPDLIKTAPPASTGANMAVGKASQAKQFDQLSISDSTNSYAADSALRAQPKSATTFAAMTPPPPPPMPATRMRQSGAASSASDSQKDFPPQTAAAVPQLARSPGAASETITVDAASIENLPLANRSSEGYVKSASQLAPIKLPSKKPVASSLVAGNRTLALDTAGTLFVSTDNGKHWTTVVAQWPGKAIQIGYAPSPARAYLAQPQQSQTQIPAAPSTGYIANGTGAAIGGTQNLQQQTVVPTAGFQLTTSTGAVWLSTDGITWRQR